jgi:4-hydroxy-3-polyprenylbenzoate decarboxylase
MSGHIVMAITGASGAVYGRRLAEMLARAARHVHLVISPMGFKLLADELGITRFSPAALVGRSLARWITLYRHDDLAGVISSGSFPTDGMVICPCSSHTLASVSAGLADNLVTRAAHVTLKEHRRLVLVHRESPLSPIEIDNMARISRAGGIICPASPGFYHSPKSIGDLVDFVVCKTLDLLGVPSNLPTRYAGESIPRLGKVVRRTARRKPRRGGRS